MIIAGRGAISYYGILWVCYGKEKEGAVEYVAPRWFDTTEKMMPLMWDGLYKKCCDKGPLPVRMVGMVPPIRSNAVRPVVWTSDSPES